LVGAQLTGGLGDLQTAGLISPEDRGNILAVDGVLTRIKGLVTTGRVVFSKKARIELALDDLTEDDGVESILNATEVRAKRSRSKHRRQPRERVYIIVAPTNSGIEIYSKGTIRKKTGEEIFYFLISAKLSRENWEGERHGTKN